MFDDNLSNPSIQYHFERGPWTETEASGLVVTDGHRSCLPALGSLLVSVALSAQLGSVPSDWCIPPQQTSHHTYAESRQVVQQTSGSQRISRAEAIRLARANRARIESRLRAEVERDAAVPAVWEDA